MLVVVAVFANKKCWGVRRTQWDCIEIICLLVIFVYNSIHNNVLEAKPKGMPHFLQPFEAVLIHINSGGEQIEGSYFVGGSRNEPRLCWIHRFFFLFPSFFLLYL